MKHMLSSALFAGIAAGLLCAVLQYFLVEPKILLAERYESRELVHFQGVAAEISSSALGGMAMPAQEPVDPWRRYQTVVFAIVTYSGYGLVMMGGIQIAETFGIKLEPRQGLLLGLAGFLAFQLMPALGLAPELPGTPSADLDARQFWWAGTAICTLVGLGFTAYGTALWQLALGVGLLAGPHIWGAPGLPTFGGVVPPELAASFAARSLAVGLFTWLTLGGLLVRFWTAKPR